VFEQPVTTEVSTSTDAKIDIAFNLNIFNYLSFSNNELKHSDNIHVVRLLHNNTKDTLANLAARVSFINACYLAAPVSLAPGTSSSFPVSTS